MKTIKFILLFTVLILSVSSCSNDDNKPNTYVYVTCYVSIDGIESGAHTFLDRYTKGDTVFIAKEKFVYLYKDKLIRDSIFVCDSIQVPYPVK